MIFVKVTLGKFQKFTDDCRQQQLIRKCLLRLVIRQWVIPPFHLRFRVKWTPYLVTKLWMEMVRAHIRFVNIKVRCCRARKEAVPFSREANFFIIELVM